MIDDILLSASSGWAIPTQSITGVEWWEAEGDVHIEVRAGGVGYLAHGEEAHLIRTVLLEDHQHQWGDPSALEWPTVDYSLTPVFLPDVGMTAYED